METNFKLYVLGSRGSHSVFGAQYEVFGGPTSCYIIKLDRHAIILDCGSGLYEAKEILSDCNVVDIFFSHVHYDHIIGLLDFNVFAKNTKITVYGTFSKWFVDSSFCDFFKGPFWPITPNIDNSIEIENDGTCIKLSDDIKVCVYASNHPNNSSIFYFNVKGVNICYLTDFENSKFVDLGFMQDADLLMYDGMFDIDDYNKHIGWGHSTWKDGVNLCKKYNVKELLIIHHNPNYDDGKLLSMEKKCCSQFNKSRFARVGDIYEF